MTLFDHPIWPHIARYGSLDEGRENLDFHQVPEQLRVLAVEVVVNCVACGVAINCLRARQLSDRSRIAGSVHEKRLIYASPCSTETNPGCSRTKAAKSHKATLRERLTQAGVH